MVEFQPVKRPAPFLKNTEMNREKLTKLYKKYNLTKDDIFKHKHYLIITRQGIEKIMALEKISILYHAEKLDPEHAVIKATAIKGDVKIETFGSAKYGGKVQDPNTKKWIEQGNTTSWYVAEMAEKRAMSRSVLKLTGFYELGVYSEDESEEFKRN